MPSSYTTGLRLEKQAFNENSDIWGDKLDNSLDCIDQATVGNLTVDVSLGNVTLTAQDALPDQARNAAYIFTGSPADNVTVSLPARPHKFTAINQTSKNVTIQVVTSLGSKVILPAVVPRAGGALPAWEPPAVPCYCDGVSVSTAINAFQTHGRVYSTAVPPNNANFSWDVPNRTWIAYVDYISNNSNWILTDDTGRRVALNISATDGTVSIPNGVENGVSWPTQGYACSELGFIAASTAGAPVGWNWLQIRNANALIGGIAFTGSGVSYNSVSDYRLKFDYGVYDVESLPDIPVHLAAWRDSGGPAQPMFFAHEVAEHRPWAVTGEKDALNGDGTIAPQMLDPAKLVPELWARVSDIEGRLQSALALIAQQQVQIKCLSSP
jgi:hypothetical protein